MPIPFAKSLRVTWTGNIREIHFYHLQVRLYDAGTPVISFRPQDLETYRETIERVTLALADPDKQSGARGRSRARNHLTKRWPRRRKKTLAKFEGPFGRRTAERATNGQGSGSGPSTDGIIYHI